MLEEIRKIVESDLIMSHFFEKPKCKPWDLVKGRRFSCCHGLGDHTRWCLGNIKGQTITIPQFKELQVRSKYG